MSDSYRPRSLMEIMNDVLSTVRDYYDAEYAYYIEKEQGDIETIYEWCAENVEWQRDRLKLLPEEQQPRWMKEEITDTTSDSYSVFRQISEDTTAILAVAGVHRGGCTLDLMRALLPYIPQAIALQKMQKQQEYLSYHPEQYELIIDGQQIREKAFLVACANASQYGNNAYIAPHANIQDGEMDITILSPFLPIDIAPLAIQLFARQIDRNSKIKTMKAKQVSIIRRKPGVMHLDGEPVMADSRIDVSVIPRVLKVYTPTEISLRREVRYLFDEVTHFFDRRLPYIFR